jgi:hypothetical protein
MIIIVQYSMIKELHIVTIQGMKLGAILITMIIIMFVEPLMDQLAII